MTKNKKVLLFIGVFLVFAVIVLSWLFSWGMGTKKDENGPILPSPTISQISLSGEKEPEMELDINSDRSGATLTVWEIDDQFSELEYELIYIAESDGQEIERGVAGGPLDIPDNRRIEEDVLFGTESCTTGVCKRHIDKNVSSGVLIIRLITSDDQVWSTEKEFEIEKTTSGYQAIWKE